jgi:hypothetical protein
MRSPPTRRACRSETAMGSHETNRDIDDAPLVVWWWRSYRSGTPLHAHGSGTWAAIQEGVTLSYQRFGYKGRHVGAITHTGPRKVRQRDHGQACALAAGGAVRRPPSRVLRSVDQLALLPGLAGEVGEQPQLRRLPNRVGVAHPSTGIEPRGVSSSSWWAMTSCRPPPSRGPGRRLGTTTRRPGRCWSALGSPPIAGRVCGRADPTRLRGAPT